MKRQVTETSHGTQHWHAPGIDDLWQHVDPRCLNSDDERRSRGSTGGTLVRSLGEQRRVGVDDHADDEDTADVEEEDTEERLLDSSGHGLSGVLRETTYQRLPPC